MKLTLRLTDEVRNIDPYQPSKTRTDTIVEVEDVQFTRGLMGAFFRALADEIDPRVREIQYCNRGPCSNLADHEGKCTL